MAVASPRGTAIKAVKAVRAEEPGLRHRDDASQRLEAGAVGERPRRIPST
jgi:hypothetical protein